ncbi:hypothetical protein [Pseudomonas baltica]|uniref:hypothetical protein n=1 Tax=Pseudomonas baltica TaxID=2762576 RepID=UPI00289B7842|nr:hypothetical protein [Pseudomonas baltica]
MWNRKKLAVVIAATLSTGTVAVMACGPFFPLQVLDNRAATLAATPSNSFAYEAAHLVKAGDTLKAIESPSNTWDDAPAVNPDQPDQASLPAAQWQALQAMRQAPSDEQAYALGRQLPPALRLYTTGAVDLLAAHVCGASGEDCGRTPEALQALAIDRFQAVLALPAEQAAPRAVWAAYALARLHAARSAPGAADASAERALALAAFAQVRSLALAGAPDPWGMAVGSYGEQARLYLSTAEQRCDYTDFMNSTACASAIAPADLKQALALYAEQAARGSDSAVQSLRMIAEWLLRDGSPAAAMVDDPLSQQLLVAYSLALMGDIVNDDPNSATDYFANADNTGQLGYADAAQGYKGVSANPVLQRLVAAISQNGVQQVAGADRLAALAYRLGDYRLAQALVDKQPGVLASWVRAKLALRRGDSEAAVQAYAEAAQGFPTLDSSIEPGEAGRLKAEQAVLSLSRGDYLQALDQFYKSGYAEDLYYVAERVLTLEELKAYVDEHVPASPIPPKPADFSSFSAEQFSTWRGQQQGLTFTQADQLRSLLARRMVRQGQIDQALGYFPDDGDPRNTEIGYDYETNTSTLIAMTPSGWAKAYGDARHDGESDWFATDRAEAWFTAANLARQHGMEIMGFQQGPDFAEFGGAYTYGTGRQSWQGTRDDSTPVPRDTPQQRAAADLPGPLVTADERDRYAASEAKPAQTFHYRYVAVALAEKAADNLPARSQAFAAVLCRAASFVQNDQPRANAVYQRYVREGAAVPFAEDFGRHCVEPDFIAAGHFTYVQAWRATRHWVHQHLYVPVGVLLVLGAGIVAWRVRRARAAS